MKQEGKETKKRISFLMPYIDFCFMLIIIFVGMLSIAYFEPTGRTDVETEKTNERNRVQGTYETNPIGTPEENTGVGENKNGETVRPLIGKAGWPGGGKVTVVQTSRGTTGQAARPASGAAATQPTTAQPAGQSGAAGEKPKDYVNPEELEKLKKELEDQKAQIEQLKKTQGAPGTGGAQPQSQQQPPSKGNSYYIDLRSK